MVTNACSAMAGAVAGATQPAHGMVMYNPVTMSNPVRCAEAACQCVVLPAHDRRLYSVLPCHAVPAGNHLLDATTRCFQDASNHVHQLLSHNLRYTSLPGMCFHLAPTLLTYERDM